MKIYRSMAEGEFRSQSNYLEPTEGHIRSAIISTTIQGLYEEIIWFNKQKSKVNSSASSSDARKYSEHYHALREALDVLRKKELILSKRNLIILERILPPGLTDSLTLEESLSLTVDFDMLASRCKGFKDVHGSRRYAWKNRWMDEQEIGDESLRKRLYEYSEMSDGLCPDCEKRFYRTQKAH